MVDEYILQLQREFPKLRIVRKPEWMRRLFASPLLSWLHLNDFTQAIWNTIYLVEGWEGRSSTEQIVTLRHEAVHLRQFRRYGPLLMSILYLFIFFPIGLAYFRAKFEREAYTESLIAKLQYLGFSQEQLERHRRRYLQVFTTREYLWAWPFKKAVLRWAEEDINTAILRLCI